MVGLLFFQTPNFWNEIAKTYPKGNLTNQKAAFRNQSGKNDTV